MLSLYEEMSAGSLSVTLRIKIETDPLSTLVQNTQSNPALSFYLSSDISPSQCNVDPIPISIGSTINVLLRCSDCAQTIDLRDACIGITMMCDLDIIDDETHTSYGYHRLEPIAEEIVFLQEMIDVYASDTALVVNLRDKTPIDDAEKIKRCVISIECINYTQSKNSRLVGKHDYHDDFVESSKMDEIYTRYVNFYKTHSARHKEIAPMHIPVWRGHHIPIPACMWIKHMISEYQIKDFIQFASRCFDIALDLNAWKKEDFVSVCSNQLKQTGSKYDSRFNMCIKIISVTSSIAANASAYVSDLCMSNDTERFKEVMSNIYAGDCEDLAFFIYTMCSSLQRRDIVDNNSPEWLSLISKICKLYVPVLVTGSATDPSMKRDSSSRNDSFMCHIYAGMFPRRELCYRLNIDSKQKDEIFSSMKREIPWNAWEEKLPSLILEGTNMNCPLMNPLFSYADRDYNIAQKQKKMECYRELVESHYPKLGLFDIELQQTNYVASCVDETNFSPFYHMITNIWCDLCRFGLEIYDFSVGYDTGMRHTYGISVCNWSNPSRDKKFCFEPVIVMSKEELKICERVINKEPPLLIPKTATMTQKKNIPECLLKLEKKYPKKATTTSDQMWVRDYISYRVTRWEKITTMPEMENVLREIFQGQDKFFDSVEILQHSIDIKGELYIGEIRLYPSNKIE